MKVTFLGTSSGTPTKLRNVSAYVIAEEQHKDWYLVDCGEGTQHQILHIPYSLMNLRAIFITHVHGDHCYGLPGLLASAGLLGRTRPLTIIAPTGIEQLVQAVFTNTDLHIGYALEFRKPVGTDMVFSANKTAVSAIEMSHRVESFAYQFMELHVESTLDFEKLAGLGIPKGPLWGRLKKGETITLGNGQQICGTDFLMAQRDPRSIIVCGDNDKPELLADACKSADVLIHEATYTEAILQQVGERVQHCSAARVAKFAQAVGVKNLVLTHFSPRFSDSENAPFNIDMITAEARALYSGNLITAADLKSYRLTRTKQFEEDYVP